MISRLKAKFYSCCRWQKLVWVGGCLLLFAVPTYSRPNAAIRLTSDASVQPLSNPYARIQITEVYYRTQGKARQWVELQNVENKSIDLKGWLLSDGVHWNIALAPKSLVVPPKGFVLIELTGTGSVAPALKGANMPVIPVASAQAKERLGTHGLLALYEPKGKAFVIRSFVAWGREPGRVAPRSVVDDAIRMRLWRSLAEYVAGTHDEPAAANMRCIETGGTMGVDDPQSYDGIWRLYSSDEATPGRANLLNSKRPIVSFLTGPAVPEGGNVHLMVYFERDGTRYQYQVAKDQGVRHLVVNKIEDGPDCIVAVPKNTIYYWRVRLIYPDKGASEWSSVRPLINGYPRR